MARNMYVKIEGVGEARTQLASLGARIMRNAEVAVATTAFNVERRAKENLTDDGAVDTGQTRAGIHAIVRGLEAEVVASAPQSPFIEFGTAPHFPPPSALEPWARRHGFEDARAGAFLIARAIAERGTPARPFLFPAAEAEWAAHLGRMRLALGRSTK